MAEQPTDRKTPPKTKAKLSHPDAFLDEVESNPDQDPDSVLKSFIPQLEAELSKLEVDFQGLTLNIESLDLSGESDEEASLSLGERWTRFKKKLKQKAIEIILKLAYKLKYQVLWLLTEGPKKIGRGLLWIFSQLNRLGQAFSIWSLKRKILFLLAAGSLGAASVFYLWGIKNKLLHKDQFQFYGAMGELADLSFDYDHKGVMEPFYDSPRVKAFYFQMKPVVVNLKREGNFNDNPMGFFEFAIQGGSGEVLVELKRRESEIIDIVERVLEDHTYDDLDTVDGKEDLKMDILKELNKKLLEGIVRRVEIRNFFIKP